MSGDSAAPIIIIKRKKSGGGDGHHGGAWKVAYADFVTAMMAFFLLMWLLNATTERQRKGLADYFSPTIPINRTSGGGDGAFWGDSVFAEDTLPQNGQGASLSHPSEYNQARGDTGAESLTSPGTPGQDKSLAEAEHLLEQLRARGGESMAELTNQRHVVTRLSDEGLIIDIFRLPDQPLFVGESDVPTPHLLVTLGVVAEVLQAVSNDIAVNAHLPARPVVVAQNPVWELSSDRAGAVRETLQISGLPADQFERVAGFADRKPVADNPMAQRNERIEIVVLRRNR
jgi:chemotaxis protein MotB